MAEGETNSRSVSGKLTRARTETLERLALLEWFIAVFAARLQDVHANIVPRPAIICTRETIGMYIPDSTATCYCGEAGKR
jgi:hypothetical protein